MTREENIKLLMEGIQNITKMSDDTSIDVTTINGETLLTDLNLDSLDVVELQMYYEEKTGSIVTDPKKELITLNDLLELLP